MMKPGKQQSENPQNGSKSQGKKKNVGQEQPKPVPTPKPEPMKEEKPEIENEVQAEVTQDGQPSTKRKQEGQTDSNQRKGRIFLKNLVFDTNEKMLRKLCTKFGEICDVNIPVDPSTNRPRGFAFVEFTNKNSALKAITDLDKSKWKGREIEVGLSVDKRRYLSNGQPASGEATDTPQVAGEDLGGDIEVVKADRKPKAPLDAEKASEKAEEDEEMDELDKIVMQNIEAMGDEFEIDSEDDGEEDEAAKKDEVKAPRKAGIEEMDLENGGEKAPQKSGQPQDLEKLLKKAEQTKKQEQAKKFDEEDLSNTCFVRGVSYDINQAEFAKFIKENIGDIFYVNLVKFKAAEGKHNGNGFIKFKDQKIADRLMDITEQFNKGEYVPKAKDPKIEINGIRLQFFPALKKGEARDIKLQREQELSKKDNKDEKKARHKKVKSLEELIAADKAGKRRLAYTKMGFFDSIDESKLNDFDKAQRSAHKDEKVAKMQNPNYFISEKRVILKNIDKLLTDIQIRELANEVLSEKMTQKELKKAKIYSDIRLLTSKSEESTGKSSGIAFIEFARPEYAETFLKEVTDHSKARKFNHKRWPIIEFAFEDFRIASKIRDAAKKQMVKKVEGDQELEQKVDKVQRKEQKEKEKLVHENDKKFVKVRLAELLEDPGKATKDKVTELVRLAKKNRGLKQRIKKKFPQFFSEGQTAEERPQGTSQSRDKTEKKDKTQLKKRIDPMRKEETKIMNKIKKKKAERKNLAENDRLDELESEYSKKLLNKSKWSNKA